MNKKYYSFGNPFKIKFRQHYCFKCGKELSRAKHCRVVFQDSENAKYYNFNIGADGGEMLGSCEFIHEVFRCSKCLEDIEFVTQINLEDIDILIKVIKEEYSRKGRTISIKKFFEKKGGRLDESFEKIEKVMNLSLLIEEVGKVNIVYRIPLNRKKYWERPYYFKLSKKQLIDFIENNSV